MALTRRDFLRLSASAGTGSALGGLAALGVSLTPAQARAQELRIKDAATIPSICPFCSVGCGTLIHVKDDDVINIEGDPRSPLSDGTLCPKGAATYNLIKNPNRPTKVMHRKPGAREWEIVDMEWALDRIAGLIKETRDETFIERLPAQPAEENRPAAPERVVNMTPSIFLLGGATLDNEFNHIAQKFGRGLGIVAIENQARI